MPRPPDSLIGTADSRRPYVHYTRPRCPSCGSIEIRSYKKSPWGTEAIMRHTLCKVCGTKFYLVLK
jgi:C4-type Zn-finger protein